MFADSAATMDPELIRTIARDAATQAINEAFQKNELISSYVREIADEAARDTFDSRLRPFYKHPTAHNLGMIVMAGLAFFGITTFFQDAVRPAVHSFLQLDKTVAQAVEKRQYEVFSGLFSIAQPILIEDTTSDVCQSMNYQYFDGKNDVVIPASAVASYVEGCFKEGERLRPEQGIPFVAEPGEEVLIEILLFGKKKMRVNDLVAQNKDYTRKELLTALAQSVSTDVRSISLESISVFVDREPVELKSIQNLISVPSPLSHETTDFARVNARHKIGDDSDKFHNLLIAFNPEKTNLNELDFEFRVFIERNRVD